MTWIKKKIGPGVENITNVEDAERILTAEDKIVLGFLNSLVVFTSSNLLYTITFLDFLPLMYLSSFVAKS